MSTVCQFRTWQVSAVLLIEFALNWLHHPSLPLSPEPRGSISPMALSSPVPMSPNPLLANGITLGLLALALALIMGDLMSLRMPTIYVVTGEASAVGCMLAFSHDYVAMDGNHGFLCMSELSALVSNQYILSLMKAKVRDDELFKELVLCSRKIPAREAMEGGCD